MLNLFYTLFLNTLNACIRTGFVSAVMVLCLAPPVSAAMNALSNEYMSRVKGDPVIDEKAPAAETSEQTDGFDVNVQPSRCAALDAKLMHLDNCSDYKKFLFYLNKIEELSLQPAGRRQPPSEKLMFFSACFADTARKCMAKLSLPPDSPPDPAATSVLNAKLAVFHKAQEFHGQLERCKNSGRASPDIQTLIAEIKHRQKMFKTLYARMKNTGGTNSGNGHDAD